MQLCRQVLYGSMPIKPLCAVLQVAYGTTVAIRFGNNVIGGENFIDMARYFGIQ